MWLFTGSTPACEILRSSKLRLHKAKPQLESRLIAHIAILESILHTQDDPVESTEPVKDGNGKVSKPYTLDTIIPVLVASANYYQYLKLYGTRSKKTHEIIQYLSPSSSRDTLFPIVCRRIGEDLQLLAADSPLRLLKLTELLNLYTYLLHIITQ